MSGSGFVHADIRLVHTGLILHFTSVRFFRFVN
jgi:hypothetical protein